MVQIHAGFHIQKHIFAVGQPLNIQIQQGIHQMTGIDACSYITHAPLSLKNRIVHGQDHTAGSRRAHNAQIGQLLLGQNRILKRLQRLPLPRRDPDGSLRGMGQDIGFRGSNIQPLENTLDRGKVLSVPLRLLQKLRVLRVKKELSNLPAQSEGRHVLFRRRHILIDNSRPGFHGVSHLVGNIVFDHGRGIGGYDGPEQKHSHQGDGCCNNADARSKLRVYQEFHKLSSAEKSYCGTDFCWSLQDMLESVPEIPAAAS